jgi:hypothetical protein
MGLQPDPGDDAQGALAADEQLGEIWALRAGREAAGACHGAIRENDLQANDHLLDLSVAGAVLASAAACHPAANGGDIEALREVADCEAVRAAQLRFQIWAEGAGQHFHDARDCVDRHDALQCRQVQQHATKERYRGAQHATTSTRRGDRYTRLVAQHEHGGDLGGGARTSNHRSALGDLAGKRPVHCQRPPIAAGLCCRSDVGDGGAQFGELCGETVGQRCGFSEARGGAGEFDRRGRVHHWVASAVLVWLVAAA